mmetsp:Transcript_17221/g.39682  ORF Transcript_17221/g.39682 Transcript_17221/m.39682 type:complete len:275 (+) Transcript_17221:2413-3237(+)
MERVVGFEQEHAGAGDDVVEDHDQNADPPNRAETMHERLDDAAEPGQGLGEAEDPEEPQEPQDHHREGLHQLAPVLGHHQKPGEDDEEVDPVPGVLEVSERLGPLGHNLHPGLESEDDLRPEADQGGDGVLLAATEQLHVGPVRPTLVTVARHELVGLDADHHAGNHNRHRHHVVEPVRVPGVAAPVHQGFGPPAPDIGAFLDHHVVRQGGPDQLLELGLVLVVEGRLKVGRDLGLVPLVLHLGLHLLEGLEHAHRDNPDEERHDDPRGEDDVE